MVFDTMNYGHVDQIGVVLEFISPIVINLAKNCVFTSHSFSIASRAALSCDKHSKKKTDGLKSSVVYQRMSDRLNDII